MNENSNELITMIKKQIAAILSFFFLLTIPLFPIDYPLQRVAKGDKMVIETVNFNEVSLKEALDFLRKKSQELDPKKTGVNIVLMAPKEAGERQITLALNNVPLSVVLKYVAGLANLELTKDGETFVFREFKEIKSENKN